MPNLPSPLTLPRWKSLRDSSLLPKELLALGLVLSLSLGTWFSTTLDDCRNELLGVIKFEGVLTVEAVGFSFLNDDV